ncbi:hypothetical protein DVH24_013938 [Malus domestica]|uniref:Uncharacterized protein n=1 Tax=Malus domestica TaxID=3750 RepID=A0A498JI46_MALDO|nr:hypothetical protein DVH24_013938 [Malus domestica]
MEGKSGRSKMSQSSTNIDGDEDRSWISELLSRYNVYEKIVNFMAPETMAVSPMLPDLNNLFGLKKQKPAFIEMEDQTTRASMKNQPAAVRSTFQPPRLQLLLAALVLAIV